ncbi:DUF3489 domain-containing protein [Muricoccus aerilatus]|uniref:DUF3489 domain-containing protein n=1 Tax=Muricoccus aerilatus TaxID=452982 RepID=UPI0006940495|nr:DUF3489 domain-containing protein [Roseomonas aerilata]
MTKPLSPTQAQILSSAAQHPAGLAEAPPNLPTAARNAVFQSMLKAGLLEEVANPGGNPARVLRITTAGLTAAGEPRTAELVGEAAQVAQEVRARDKTRAAAPEAQVLPVSPAAQPQPRSTLRDAATALLVAWDAGEGRPDLPGAVEALRAALSRAGATRSSCDPSAPRRPREGTKQASVLTLLRQSEGATIAQVMEATGWAQHTVRGFLAGLKKRGHTVEVLERVRQVGAGAQGAKGSYSVYRIAAGVQG